MWTNSSLSHLLQTVKFTRTWSLSTFRSRQSSYISLKSKGNKYLWPRHVGPGQHCDSCYLCSVLTPVISWLWVFKHISSPFSLIQSMLHVFSHVISGRRQTGQSIWFFPKRFNKKKKTQQRKKPQEKKCKNHLEHIRRIPTFFFFLTFILNPNMQGRLSTSIHIPSPLSGPNIESGFKALQMLLLLSNYE